MAASAAHAAELDPLQMQPALVCTAIVPAAPSTGTVSDAGVTVHAHPAAVWLIASALPAAWIVPLLDSEDGFEATV